MSHEISLSRRLVIIFSIVFAGEIIFSLPFHVARFFRPTLLDVFSLTNTQLGDIFGLYGIMAMLAYFPGGAIADRFSGRRLMSFSLLTTALGGIYFVQIPSPTGLALLFAYWGVTTILLFWASMIKVTRQWGGKATQGKAFGILDGGRGLVAAGVASIAVLMITMAFPTSSVVMNINEQTSAIKTVISFYSLLTVLAAVLIWFTIPKVKTENLAINTNSITAHKQRNAIAGIIEVLKQPKVWLQAFIVLAAYCAYKSLDYFGLYATTVLGINELDSARMVSNASYLRPIAAITAGIIADKLRVGRVISWFFVLLSVSYLLFSLLLPNTASSNLIIEANFLLTFLLVFAIRGIYFALLEETKLSGQLTGTAVGIISVVGFTPDIFFAPIAGRIIDSAPGIDGFNQLFMLLFGISASGFTAAYLLAKRVKEQV
ncbi:MFS transporter [Thalassotalea psychrophila]|uniref:MFS transporter n=1 Tax=Thalassotalea psychrophila TaxID=3065647 RepID=A0ABY9TPZ2_9GAMM|nr:MFS transporter [Colwelliaceae bacterium SQ149]